MRRRDFIITVLNCAAAWPAVGYAEQSQTRLPLVAVLLGGSPSAPMIIATRQAIQQGLREEGYVDGQNITIEYKYGDVLKGANELVRLNPKLIVATGTAAALATKGATDTTPVVASTMADPVADGLVASLARPGGNVTGNTFLGPELEPKRLELLRELVPDITRIAVLQHPGVYGERTMQNMLAEIEAGAKASDVEVQVFNSSNPDNFDGAFVAMANARIAGLIIFPSQMFYVNYRRLVELAAKYRLPTVYVFREAVEGGGLISYGADVPDLLRRAGKYVARILKGARPADLPVERPTKFELAINLKTAKALGLTVPPSLLARADEVIE